MAIKKSDEKKLKSIESKFYLEALGSENFSIGDYGLDRRRLGRALGKILRKYGTWFNTSDRYCFMIVNHMEDLGLIKEAADKFVAVENWREALQKMFPKETLLGTTKKQTEIPVTVAVTPVVPVETPSPAAEPATPQRRVITVGTLKNNYEFYEVLLERIGEDFKTQEELKKLILELFHENFGEMKPFKQYVFNRIAFLQKNKILESIEDEGVVKHLRSKDYKELLDAKKSFLEKNPYEFKIEVPETPKEEPAPIQEAPKKEEKPESVPVPVGKTKEPTVCVCINPMDLTKLYETEVLFNDGHKCIVLLETIPANLDVLKNIDAEADPKGQNQLWEKLAEQREYYLAELAKIERLCGKKA
jgi:hypothetical protein